MKSRKKTEERSVLMRILSFTKPYSAYIVFTMIFALISVALTLYAPILTGDAIDLIIEKGKVDFAGQSTDTSREY